MSSTSSQHPFTPGSLRSKSRRVVYNLLGGDRIRERGVRLGEQYDSRCVLTRRATCDM